MEFDKEYQELVAKYGSRHGGPFDRGTSDSYYYRTARPHYFVGDTHQSREIPRDQMTPQEVEAYMAGYNYNEKINFKKQYI